MNSIISSPVKVSLLTPSFNMNLKAQDGTAPLNLLTGLQVKQGAIVLFNFITIFSTFTVASGNPNISIGTTSNPTLFLNVTNWAACTANSSIPGNLFGIMDNTLNIIVQVTGGEIAVGSLQGYLFNMQ